MANPENLDKPQILFLYARNNRRLRLTVGIDMKKLSMNIVFPRQKGNVPFLLKLSVVMGIFCLKWFIPSLRLNGYALSLL